MTSSPSFCNSCGAPTVAGSKFCTSCGAAYPEQVTTTPAHVESAAPQHDPVPEPEPTPAPAAAPPVPVTEGRRFPFRLVAEIAVLVAAIVFLALGGESSTSGSAGEEDALSKSEYVKEMQSHEDTLQEINDDLEEYEDDTDENSSVAEFRSAACEFLPAYIDGDRESDEILEERGSMVVPADAAEAHGDLLDAHNEYADVGVRFSAVFLDMCRSEDEDEMKSAIGSLEGLVEDTEEIEADIADAQKQLEDEGIDVDWSDYWTSDED